MPGRNFNTPMTRTDYLESEVAIVEDEDENEIDLRSHVIQDDGK